MAEHATKYCALRAATVPRAQSKARELRAAPLIQMHELEQQNSCGRCRRTVRYGAATASEQQRIDRDDRSVDRVRALVTLAVHLDLYGTAARRPFDALVASHRDMNS